jgi:predicted nucleic acid-binding protein
LYLIDTNVLSELRKGRKANPSVMAFFSALDPVDVYLPVQVIGELRSGIEHLSRRGDVQQARQLEDWLNQIVEEYGDRILGFDHDCAQVWGILMSDDGQNPIDKQIASIGMIYSLTVVTRNDKHFARLGATLFNPFNTGEP